MEKAAITSSAKGGGEGRATGVAASGVDARAAPRITLLIRAAKLVAANGEFVCVIRDVSETGISMRMFHKLPPDETFELHMPGGRVYPIRRIWNRDNEAGFAFHHPVEVSDLIEEAGQYPKRGLRLRMCFPIRIKTLTQSCTGIVENLSQQGARFECDELFAIDQTLRIAGGPGVSGFDELRTKVRWRRDHNYGVVFDDTFTLGDFARVAARLQFPALLDE